MRAGFIVVLVVGAVAALGVISVAPQHREGAIDAYLLLVAALAMQSLVAHLSRELPAVSCPTRRPKRGRSRREPSLEELDRIEGSLAIAPNWAAELYYRVRPLLAEIAAERLSRRGVSQERDPEAAREVLGEDAWALLRPDLPPPEDRLGPGLSLGQLERIVTALEGV